MSSDVNQPQTQTCREKSYSVTNLFGEGDKSENVAPIYKAKDYWWIKNCWASPGVTRLPSLTGHLLKLPVSTILVRPDESCQFNYHFIVVCPSHLFNPKGTIWNVPPWKKRNLGKWKAHRWKPIKLIFELGLKRVKLGSWQNLESLKSNHLPPLSTHL